MIINIKANNLVKGGALRITPGTLGENVRTLSETRTKKEKQK
jgi:hypothetical protein